MFARNILIASAFAAVAATGLANDAAKKTKPVAAPAAAVADCTKHVDEATCGKDKACKWTADAAHAGKGSCAKADKK